MEIISLYKSCAFLSRSPFSLGKMDPNRDLTDSEKLNGEKQLSKEQ